MIGSVAQLFVERTVCTPPAAANLSAALRVLAVDACQRSRRIGDVLVALERRAPVTASLVRLDDLGLVPEAAAFDTVLLFVDEGSDTPYALLALSELEQKPPGVHTAVVAVGRAGGGEPQLVLPEAALGAAPPWRRRRAASDAAGLLAGLLRDRGAGER
jgi:hypothetical protein